MVLCVGEDNVEIMGDAKGKSVRVWINGISGDERELTNNALLDHSISGYPIYYQAQRSMSLLPWTSAVTKRL